MDVTNVIDKIWNTVRQKVAAFAEGEASEEFTKIGEDTYCEEHRGSICTPNSPHMRIL